MRVYVSQPRVSAGLRKLSTSQHLVSDDDYFIQWRITALFLHLVLSRCAVAGVTPLTARDEVNLTQALIDAETEVGVYLTDDEMTLLSESDKRRVIERKLRRRRYAYLVLLRLTSGAILP